MIVPAYWAEARLQEGTRGRSVTVRRFGWSDESLAAAQAQADARALEAMQRIRAGEKLERREPKVAYNGAEGVPIREEIVSRHGTALITRNLYGARCLNTPDVLFVDIDFAMEIGARLLLVSSATLLLGAVVAGWAAHSWALACAAGFAALFGGPVLVSAAWRALRRLGGGEEEVARARVDRFVHGHPDWRLRLYRTPAGFRVLVLHRTFEPGEAAVAECFSALGTDPVYVKMCVRQRCFRARVSPKPWRIGIPGHIKPRPGVWPVNPDRLPERTRWIDAYEKAAREFAACRFVEEFGSSTIHPSAQAVQTLHDELCGAGSHRPIA